MVGVLVFILGICLGFAVHPLFFLLCLLVILANAA